MAFVTIDPNKIKIGDPITKDLWDLLKNNLDDLDTRVTALSSASIIISALNGDVSFVGYSALRPVIFNYKVIQNFSVNDFRVQLFSKQSIVSGSLTLRLEKSINTNDANFATILTTDLVFDFAIDADYAEKTGAINSLLNSVVIGDVLRIKVISLPVGFSGDILISLSGQ
jgi:hypothetical protein